MNKIDIFSQISNENYNNSEKKRIFLFSFSQGKWRKKWSFFDIFVKNDGSKYMIFKFWEVKNTIYPYDFVTKWLFSKKLIYSCDFEKNRFFFIFLKKNFGYRNWANLFSHPNKTPFCVSDHNFYAHNHFRHIQMGNLCWKKTKIFSFDQNKNYNLFKLWYNWFKLS